MDDPLLVGHLEGLRNLRRNREGVVERDWTLRDPVGQRRPFDELEDERSEHAALRLIFLNAIDAADVRVIERREDLGFALEARQPIGVVG